MYLIIKDHKAGTVRVNSVSDALREIMTNYSDRMVGILFSKEKAEEHAKSIAIKENLVYTPQIEY